MKGIETEDQVKAEVEKVMLPYFNDSQYDFCRWLLRKNDQLGGYRPFDLYEQGRCGDVLSLARAIVEHHNFLNNIGIG